MAGDKKKKTFTDKEEKFIDEYLISLNATLAAKKAGYSHDSARQIGSENLSKPYIYAEIERRRKILREKSESTLEDIITEVQALAFAELSNFCEWDEHGNITVFKPNEIHPKFRKAFKKIKRTISKDGGSTEVEFDDKSKNLKLLAELLGFLSDKPGDSDTHTTTVTEFLHRINEGKKPR